MSAVASGAQSGGFDLTHHLDKSIEVSRDGVELFAYTYAPDTVQLESPKPYFHPLRTLSGDVVSLFRPHDHVWHKGIAWSLPHVGDNNFWGGPTYIHGQHYVQLQNNGRATHRTLTSLHADAESAGLSHDLDWTTQQGELVITEHRAVDVAVVGDAEAWAMLFSTSMTNVSPLPLLIGSPTTKGRENAGYGGLFWRGPRSFTGGVIHTPSGSGGEELRGTRDEWMGFTGQHDGTSRYSTIVMVDAATNPAHPPQWFARTELFACLCPAPFFSEELEVAPGETIQFRYAVVIADGNADVARAAQLAGWGREALAKVGAAAAAAVTA